MLVLLNFEEAKCYNSKLQYLVVGSNNFIRRQTERHVIEFSTASTPFFLTMLMRMRKFQK
ncbi:hypothetical protein T01_7996 [Trichinella spiralis]|uniref:Uncharacterized protein n=1 Tax=Trichinella spiralis TaxID=6334 RepID=A0A0V1ATI9_TRISP|nr:hypothetical protein T01_8148 [Trichinella spiralis]KRY28128.1 hypothetical protein T01_7996 [Trichinella spiralis]